VWQSISVFLCVRFWLSEESNRILGVNTAQWRQVDLQAQLQTTRLDAEGVGRCCFGIEQSIFAAPHTPQDPVTLHTEFWPTVHYRVTESWSGTRTTRYRPRYCPDERRAKGRVSHLHRYCISRSFYARFYAAAIRTLHDQKQGHG
jgi:hypothetical protein